MRAGQGSGTATVLFTDIVGSTELMARLGDLSFDEVRGEHFAVLREAVVKANGDEVKTTGDGMVAVFASAVDALSCAVAMQQGVHRHRREDAPLLEIRIGLALGEVTFEAGDVFGTAVVEAARLVARATGGQILATGLLRAVVGTRSPARFVDLGPLELKGLPEPIPTYEVVWERSPTPTFALPQFLDRTYSWSFVGRDDEFEDLRRLWKESATGQRTVEFDLDVLRIMLAAEDASDQEALLAAIEEAVAARLMVEIPGPAMSGIRFRFAHALVRDTVYEGLSAARRQVMHGRAGLAIEAVRRTALDAHLPALAYHFAAAGAAGDPAKAVEYARRCGDQAMARLAFEPAATFYEQALAALAVAPTLGDNGLRCRLLLSRGDARAHSGDHGAWDDYLAAAGLAREQGDAEALGQAALGLADVWVWSWVHSDQVRIDLLDEALAAQGGADTALRARLAARLAGQLYWIPGSLDRRQALAAEAVAVARRLGDPATLAACLDSTTFATWIPSAAEQRRAAGEEIVALAGQVGDRELALKGHAWCHIASLEESDPAALDGSLAAYEACATELGQPRYEWYALTQRAMQAILVGDLDAGEALAHEAHASGRIKEEGDAEPLFSCQMSLVWQERPSSEAADQRETLRRLYAANPPGVPTLMAAARAHGVALALGAHRDAEVRAELDAVNEVGLASLEPSLAWTGIMAKVASALARVGTEAEIVDLYELILPSAGLNAFCFGAVSYWGALAHHVGVLAARLGLWDDAEAHLADAAATHERLGARVWLARTQLETAALLAARNRPGDAGQREELLRTVLASATALRLPSIAERAQALGS